MNLTGNLLKSYLRDPQASDAAVRAFANMPSNRYYTVSIWPVAGHLRISRFRDVPVKKISKSS